jgi:exodeoxyribonuclease VII large subunit
VQKLKLSELTGIISKTLNDAFQFQTYWVIADIAGYSLKTDKNQHYLELVEKGNNSILAKINAVAWREGHEKIKVFENETGQKLGTGLSVLLHVKVEYHAQYGLKLLIIDVDASFTLGEMERQRRETINRLLQECSQYVWIENNRIVTKNKNLDFGVVIQNIAVISSAQSAGYEDFIKTLELNQAGYKFKVDPYFTVVQGENNADLIFRTIIGVFESKKNYDVLVIIRGGGAETDFLVFNHFDLGRIVARYPLPIITGLGHTRNESIVDLMAHTNAITPTKAAEFIIAHNANFEQQLNFFRQKIIMKSQQILAFYNKSLPQLNAIIINKSRDYLKDYLESLNRLQRIVIQQSTAILQHQKNNLIGISSTFISKPQIIISSKQADLNNLLSNIYTFNAQYLKNQKSYLNHFVSLIRVLSPDNILKRGFAIIEKQGKIITNPKDIKKGDELSIRLKQTELNVTVNKKSN